MLEEVVSAFCSSPFLAPAWWAAEISRKNHIRTCSLINCLHYLIFCRVKSLRETGYHLLLGINPGINSTEEGSGVYSGTYGEGAPPPPPRSIWYTFPGLVTLCSCTPPPIAPKNRGFAHWDGKQVNTFKILRYDSVFLYSFLFSSKLQHF